MNTTPYKVIAKTTQDELKEAQKKKEETEGKLNDAQDEKDALNKKKKTLQKELASLNEELDGIMMRLEDLRVAIANKEDEIAQTQAALAEARQIEADQYAAMKKRIQFMYEDSSTLYLEMLFSAKNFSELITISNYIESLEAYDRKKLDEYEANRISMEELEAVLISELAELDDLKAEAEVEQANVEDVIAKTAANISEYSDLIDEAEAICLAYEAEIKKQEEDIEALKKKIEEERRLSLLAAQSAWRDISQITFEDNDRMMLANIIYCEAGGEPYEGKLAVASVVINRVLSSVYPSTVSAVIYQPYQFSPVLSGRFGTYLAIDKASRWPDCYRAADEAMSGVTNVGNCLHFRTPIPGLEGINIGGHVFY